MELRDFLPGIIGSFVGVMGWLLVGLYIQRRQFMRQARNAAKAVYFELDVNLTSLSVARDHGLFSDLDRSSFERLLPELATLLAAPGLKTVVDAYMTHAGYRQLASRGDLPGDVRRVALTALPRARQRPRAVRELPRAGAGIDRAPGGHRRHGLRPGADLHARRRPWQRRPRHGSLPCALPRREPMVGREPLRGARRKDRPLAQLLRPRARTTRLARAIPRGRLSVDRVQPCR